MNKVLVISPRGSQESQKPGVGFLSGYPAIVQIIRSSVHLLCHHWKIPESSQTKRPVEELQLSASHNGFILFSSQRHQSLLESDSTGEEVCELTTHRATIALLGGNKKQISLKRLILERLCLSFCSMLTNFLQC